MAILAAGATPGISPPLGRRLLDRRAQTGTYITQLAGKRDEVRAAQELRFMVFNLELQRGLSTSFNTLRDEDPFDEVCDHLLVKEVSSDQVVGTYRLQTGRMARAHLGFYSAQEFEFGPYASRLDDLVELGRACVHRAHRNLHVLGLLWQGIVAYGRQRGAKHFVGCSSLNTIDPALGLATFAELARHHLADPSLRTEPLPAYRCVAAENGAAALAVKVPKLLRAYLSLGGKICGPPALDHEFGTVDFLTWLDLECFSSLPESLP